MKKEGLLEVLSPCLGDNEIDTYLRKFLEYIEGPDDETANFVPAPVAAVASVPFFRAEEERFCFKPFGIEQCG